MKHSKHDPKSSRRDGAPNHRAQSTPRGSVNSGGAYWIYGDHAVSAALANPQRIVRRIVASKQSLEQLVLPASAARKLPQLETHDARSLDSMLGGNAVHQGIGAYVEPLQAFVLEDIIHIAKPRGPLIVLDQVSDPHNVGAILRSAAAFEAVGVLMPKDHSAPETAVMAKAASGALDLVPRITVTNLATAMRELKAAGWWITGLSGDAKQSLTDIKFSDKNVLIMGAEGRGMRRLTAELCDKLAHLPIAPQMESLNVSNAAAIALYHCYTTRKHG